MQDQYHPMYQLNVTHEESKEPAVGLVENGGPIQQNNNNLEELNYRQLERNNHNLGVYASYRDHTVA